MVTGGFADLKEMFRLLKTRKADDKDDGTVVDHHNLSD